MHQIKKLLEDLAAQLAFHLPADPRSFLRECLKPRSDGGVGLSAAPLKQRLANVVSGTEKLASIEERDEVEEVLRPWRIQIWRGITSSAIWRKIRDEFGEEISAADAIQRALRAKFPSLTQALLLEVLDHVAGIAASRDATHTRAVLISR